MGRDKAVTQLESKGTGGLWLLYKNMALIANILLSEILNLFLDPAPQSTAIFLETV